jgi:hypothetical protein
MTVSRSMEDIWRIKEEAGLELEGKTDEEIIAFFQEREPEWSKVLPRFDPASTVVRKPDRTTP